MKPSGLNSIEYILHFIGVSLRILGYVILVATVGPVLYLLWSWNTMKFQERAIDALNAAPMTELQVDFNRCAITPAMLERERNWALAIQQMSAHDAPDPIYAYPLPFEVRLGDKAPDKELAPWVLRSLPWAPGLQKDPQLVPKEPIYSYGGYEGMYLDHYRRHKDIPHTDPWYYHGLLKLSPTKHWDDGTGPDYAFGKVAGNYLAYAGACRAVASMRYLLGARAMGFNGDNFRLTLGDVSIDSPIATYNALTKLRPGDPDAFLRGYNTDFNGQLPVLTLDLEKFDDGTWGGLRGECSDGVEWDKRMG